MASVGWPCAQEVRMVISKPAAAQRLATSAMWSSDPPASTSSRSRHASTWTRRMPADAARSPILARGSASSGTALLTGGRPPQGQEPGRSTVTAVGWGSATGTAVCYGLPCQRTNAWEGAHDPTEQPVASTDDTHATSLTEALGGVEGWFSPVKVARVSDRASQGPPTARIVEIGSFRGRSMVAIARSAPEGAEIVAIDPHAGNDRGPQEIEGFADEAAVDSKVFLANLERAGVRDRVTYVRKFSHDALGDVGEPIDLLHIDGAHRLAPASDDIRRWGARVRPGGTMLVHDSFSSVGVTLALAATVMFSGDWRYAGRSRSLAEYRREPVRGRARLANAGRQLAQLPWFARNLAIKSLIVAKVPRVARALGHDGDTWPY